VPELGEPVKVQVANEAKPAKKDFNGDEFTEVYDD